MQLPWQVLLLAVAANSGRVPLQRALSTLLQVLVETKVFPREGGWRRVSAHQIEGPPCVL